MIIDGEERLACTYQVNSDIMVLLPQQTHLQSITADGYLKDFTPDPWPQDSYGVAVDIGTTTVVATLYDLAQAEAIDSLSLPQFAEGLWPGCDQPYQPCGKL